MTPRSSDGPLTGRLTTGDAPRRATGHLPVPALQAVTLALPDRLQRPSDERQMRRAQRKARSRTAPVPGSPSDFPTTASETPD